MKVLQLSTSDYGGGAERAARDLHRGLGERQVESHLLVGRRREPEHIETEALYGRDLPVQRAWSRARQYFEAATGRQASTSRAFGRWWEANSGTWDALVCHNLHGVYFDLGILPELAAAVPVVQVLHDLWPLTGHCAYPMECERFRQGCGNCPDLGRLPSVWRDRTAAERKRKTGLLQRASPVLVCVSQWVSEQVSLSGLAGLGRVVIPYGIPDVAPAVESRARIRERLGWPRDKSIFLYVSSGGLQGTSYKDPETLIAAARELQQGGAAHDKLIVTAGGKRALDDRLSPLILQYGHVSSGLEDFYQAADYFVYPTRIETVGLVLVEAARAGLPAITVRAGGCPEVVQHKETGLVAPPADPRALAAAMCEITKMDRAALAQAARKRYVTLFTLDRMAAAYLELLERLVSKRRGGRPAHRTAVA